MPTINVRWSDNTEELRKNLARGTTQLEATRAGVDKLVKAFQGDNLVAAAHKWAVAIDQIGGITKLTAAEQQRANAIFEKAHEKLTLMGKGSTYAADQFRLLADQTKKVEQPTSALNNWIGQLATGIASTAAGFVSAQAIMGAVGTAFRTVTAFVSESVKAYAEAESAQVKLTAAMRAQGTATPEVLTKYNALATEFQRTTVFSDDLITSMQALLIQVGGVMPDEMDAALKASTNLAAGLGIDLETATTLVAKAASGHTETLGRYGITVDTAALKTEGFTAVLDAINRQFGGQAAAQVETYAGSVQQMANAWDNVKEAVGKAIVEDPAITLLMKNIADGAKGADDGVSGLGLTIAGMSKYLDVISPALSVYIGRLEMLAEVENKRRELAANPPRDINLPPMPPAGFVQGQTFPEGFFAPLDADIKKTAAALAAYNALVREVAATHDTFAQTIDTIDGKVVEGIRYYLERGKSVEQLATMYGVLTTQVEAVSEQMKLEAAATKEAAAAAEVAFKAFVAEVTALNELAAALRRVEHGNDRMNVDLTKIGERVEVLPPKVKEASSAFADLAKAFAQLSQIGGGSFSGIVQGIGTMIGAINLAVTAVAGLNKAIKDGTANAGTYVAAYSAAFTGIGVGLQLLSDWTTAGMKRQDELGRKINAIIDAFYAPFQDAISRVEGGLHLLDEAAAMAGISLDRFHAALNMPTSPAKYLEIVSAINEINAALAEQQRLAGLASKFGPSRADLQKAAVDAKDVLDFMTASSLDAQGQILANAQFTQEQLNAAYLAWQTALAAAGDVAAQAWLDAQKGVTAGAAAVNTALSALQKKRDDLQKSVDQEAPEEVMGVLEAEARASIAAIDEQIAAVQRQAEEAAAAAGEASTTAGDYVSDAARDIEQTMGTDVANALIAAASEFDAFGPKALAARDSIDAQFSGFSITIPITFLPGAMPSLPSGNVGAGGAQYAASGGTVRSWGLESWGMSGLSGPRGTDRVQTWLTPGETVRTPQQEARVQSRLGGSGGGASRVDVHAHLSLDGHEVTSVVVTDVLQDKRGAGTKLRRGLRLTED